MNPLAEIGLVMARELRKNLRSAKGAVLLALSLLGGAATALVLVKLRELDRNGMGSDEMHAAREAFLTKAYDDPALGKHLADAPAVLLTMFFLTIWLGPLLVALMGFDAISGEIQHRTVRFWSVRIPRASLYIGKFAGLWAAVSLVTLVMNLCIWIVTVARGEASFADAVSWGLRFWVASLPIGAAWCGIATLIGSQFRTPILSLLVIFAGFAVLWIAMTTGGLTKAEWLKFVYPNTFDGWLLSPRLERSLGGLGICAAFAAVTTAVGSALFVRRDI